MKVHRTLVEAVAHALHLIFHEGKYADKVIERLLKSNPRWGSRDRAFIAENTYEIVRWRRLVEEVGRLNNSQISKDAISLVRLVGVNLALKNPKFVGLETNIPEFAGLDGKIVAAQKKALETERKIAQSIPDWLDEVGERELGERWGIELSALNEPSAVVVRANILKTNKLALKKELAKEDWDADETPLAPDALVLRKRGSMFHVRAFHEGHFELQDAGSQCIAPFLHVEPGMRVVDACAGAGGKSLHLAALMRNQGTIISLDTEAWKLDELRRRAKRNGVQIIQTRPIESSKTIKRLHGTADRLLLDVPCSGLGTLRRNPDAKWKLTPEFLDNVRATQADILRSYSKILRPGGQLVYATCSILPSENEKQVERFLSENPNFRLLEERKLTPAEHGFDGFYMARIEMVNASPAED